MTVTVRPFDEQPFGAEILGVDTDRPPDPETCEVIARAMAAHLAVVIAEAAAEPDWLLAVGRRLGPLVPHVLDQYHHPATPEISIISFNMDNAEARTTPKPAGAFWHSDLSYKPAPSDAILLYADVIPPTGGDTLICDMRAAHDALPVAIRSRLAGLTAVHRWGHNVDGAQPRLTDDQENRLADVVHPVVRVHPGTGRKALFVSPGYTVRIEGVSALESDDLLGLLFEHTQNPAFHYRHQWARGQLLAVDNRATMHCAIADYAEPRRMLRMIVGCTDPAYARAD